MQPRSRLAPSSSQATAATTTAIFPASPPSSSSTSTSTSSSPRSIEIPIRMTPPPLLRPPASSSSATASASAMPAPTHLVRACLRTLYHWMAGGRRSRLRPVLLLALGIFVLLSLGLVFPSMSSRPSSADDTAAAAGWLPPRAYRPLILVTAWLWLWTCSLQVLERCGIPALDLLQLEPSSSLLSPPPPSEDDYDTAAADDDNLDPEDWRQRYVRGLFGLALAWSTGVAVLLLVARRLVPISESSDTSSPGGFSRNHAFPLVSYLLFLAALVHPWSWWKEERYRLLGALRRLVFLPRHTATIYADVILADVLTSFARVLGDVVVVACTFLQHGDKKEIHSVLLPLVISVPYMIRLRQCLHDYLLDPKRNQIQRWNALKYFSVVPVLALGALLHSTSVDPAVVYPAWYSQTQVLHGSLSMMTVSDRWLMHCVHSAYSYYWDVVQDWDLGHLEVHPMLLRHRLQFSWAALVGWNRPGVSEHAALTLRRDPPDAETVKEHPRPSRSPTRHPPVKSTSVSRHPPHTYPHAGSPSVYYVGMTFNLAARFAWAIRLVVLPSHLVDHGWTLFGLQVLELIRRWVWLLFRMERQSLGLVGAGSGGIGIGGVSNFVESVA